MGLKTDTTGNRFSLLAYERYAFILRRYILNRVRNHEDARELAQEVWTRLLRIQDPGKVLEPRKYIYKVAANVVTEFQHLRRRDVVDFDSEAFTTAAAATPATEQMADDLNAHRDFELALQTLSPTFRDIVLLRLNAGYSYQEIGDRFGIAGSTAKRYFFNAMSQVRSTWARRTR